VFHGFIDITIKKIILCSHVTNASFWVIKFNVLGGGVILYDTGHCGISRNKTKPGLKILFFIFQFKSNIWLWCWMRRPITFFSIPSVKKYHFICVTSLVTWFFLVVPIYLFITFKTFQTILGHYKTTNIVLNILTNTLFYIWNCYYLHLLYYILHEHNTIIMLRIFNVHKLILIFFYNYSSFIL